MFIMTAKLTKARAVAGILFLGAVLCALIFAASHLHQSSSPIPAPENVSSNEDRVAYLAAWGWEVESSAVETLDLVLPETFDASFEQYNALQQENDMDLSPYCGARVKRYTYAVLNYPDRIDSAQANLYLYEDIVIAGDITIPGANGFVAGLHYPKSVSP